MKKKLLIFIILSGLILLMSACCTPKTIVVPREPIVCPSPVKPLLKEMDSTKTLASPTNFNVILENFKNQTKYTKELESTVKCYTDSLAKDPSK